MGLFDCCDHRWRNRVEDKLDTLIALLRGRGVRLNGTLEVAAMEDGVKTLEITTEDRKVKATLHPTTPAGNPTTVDGVPAWTEGELRGGTLTPAADGLSAVYEQGADPTLGVVTFSVEADAKHGPDVVGITETFELTIVDPMASTLNATLEVVPA